MHILIPLRVAFINTTEKNVNFIAVFSFLQRGFYLENITSKPLC